MAGSASYSLLSNLSNLIPSNLKGRVWRGYEVVFSLENGKSYHRKSSDFLVSAQWRFQERVLMARK
jgi:hypothetical protein